MVSENGIIETAFPELDGLRDDSHVYFNCPFCGVYNSTNTFDNSFVVCANCWEKFTWPLD